MHGLDNSNSNLITPPKITPGPFDMLFRFAKQPTHANAGILIHFSCLIPCTFLRFAAYPK